MTASSAAANHSRRRAKHRLFIDSPTTYPSGTVNAAGGQWFHPVLPAFGAAREIALLRQQVDRGGLSVPRADLRSAALRADVAAPAAFRYFTVVAPVAQLDRALPSEGKGQRFESPRARQ